MSKYLDSAIDRACALALDDVPTFQLRRKSEADIIFAELVGEKPYAPKTVYTVTSSTATYIPTSDIILPNIEIMHGPKQYSLLSSIYR
jgi:hypothetical protein